MADTSPLKDRLERLLDRLMDKGVVTFIGAGVSYNAKCENGQPFRSAPSSMVDALKEKFEKEIGENEIEQEEIIPVLFDEKTDAFGKKTKAVKKDLYLDRLAELGTWLWGSYEVCQTIGIDKYECLEPLQGHRYLAYLAREGLIREIVSTNYDCCIEKAFEESFDDTDLFNDDDVSSNPLAIVRDIDEYRKKGGFQSTVPDDFPVLHLYKINGCAKQFGEKARSSDPIEMRNAADRIILTERQLHTFRGERWAQDLFRDRARRRNFLFCGFGSEEPQVRHTALSISEEFASQEWDKSEEFASQDRGKSEESANQETNNSDLEKIARLPNAPFMCAHRDISFPQLQILRSFVEAHLKENDDKMQKALHGALFNFFSGKDGQWIGPVDDKLPSDVFFKRLFQAAFGRLIMRRAKRGSIFYNWLDQLTDNPLKWCWFLMERLYPAQTGFSVKVASSKNGPCRFDAFNGECEKNLIGNEELPGRYFGLWNCLLEHEKSEERPSWYGPLILWQWLWAVRRPNAEKLQKGWYLPINRDELFILVSLLLIVCMAELEERDPEGGRVLRCPQKIVRPVKGLGLEIKLSENRSRFPQSMMVYLKHKHAKCANIIDVSNSRGEAGPGSDVKNKRIYLFVSIPSCNFWENERRLNIVSESDKGRNSIKTLWVANQKTISA